MGKFCTNCGTQLNEGARFCAKCGTSVSAHPIPVTQREEAPRPAEVQQPKHGLPKATSAPQSNNKQPAAEKHGKKGKPGNVLCVFLTVLFIIESAAVALFGWPGFAVGGGHKVKFIEIKVENGLAKEDGVFVDLKDNGGIQSFGIAKTAKAIKEEGTVSDTYEFAFDTIPQESIKISMPAKDGLILADNEMLYIDVGVSVTGDSGEEFMFHDFIKASIVDDMLTAEITPSAYATPENTVYTGAAGVAKRTYTDKFRFNAVYSTKVGKESSDRHFKLIFDSVYAKSSVSDEDISELLSKMEQVYNQMAAFGFDMSARTAWPLEVYIKHFSEGSSSGSATDGLYVMKPWGINYSHIELNRRMFVDFKSDYIISIFAHEFMHLLQHCKVSLGKQLKWLNESTAVFFENYFGGSPDYGARYLEVFDGIYPPSDSSTAGYARPSLISYWATKNDWLGGMDSLSGKDKMSGLINLYSTGGYVREGRWNDWISACMGNPSEYTVDFFTKVVLCDKSVWGDKEGIIKPYLLHGAITAPVKEKPFMDRVKIFFGRYKEQDLYVDAKNKFKEMKLLGPEISSEKGQSLKVSVPAYGAKVVALSMTEAEQKAPESDAAIGISDDGPAELVLFKCKGMNVETINGDSPSAPDFVNNLKDKCRYLILVVNTTNKAISAELNVKIDNGVDLEKLKALYNGTWSSADDYKNAVVFEVVNTGLLKYKYSHMEDFDTLIMEPSPDGTRLGLSSSVGIMSMGNIYFDTDTGILTWTRTNGENRLFSKESR